MTMTLAVTLRACKFPVYFLLVLLQTRVERSGHTGACLGHEDMITRHGTVTNCPLELMA